MRLWHWKDKDMFYGKMKAVTFSYDDGVAQDKRLLDIFNRYGLKGTFNLNSGKLNEDYYAPDGEVRYKIRPREIKNVYQGHEVAVHTVTHTNLTTLDTEDIIREVEQDRIALEDIVGYPVVGMAYPCGGVNNDDRVAEVLRNDTKVRYSRTTTSTFCFEPQENLYRFNPTVKHTEWEQLERLTEEFLSAVPDTPMLFYIWGHSYEFDFDDSWARFEAVCRELAHRDDVFYGTNRQVFGL